MCDFQTWFQKSYDADGDQHGFKVYQSPTIRREILARKLQNIIWDPFRYYCQGIFISLSYAIVSNFFISLGLVHFKNLRIYFLFKILIRLTLYISLFRAATIGDSLIDKHTIHCSTKVIFSSGGIRVYETYR